MGAKRTRGRLRVCFLLVVPTPYRTPMLRGIGALDKVKLDVIYCRASTEERPWDLSFLRGSPAEFLEPGTPKSGIAWLVAQASILRRLWRGKHDLVVVNGYHRLALILAILFCRLTRVPYGLLSESHLLQKRPAIRRVLKHFWVQWVVSGTTVNFAVGTLAKEYLLHYGAPQHSVFLLPNTCDVDDFARRSAHWRAQRDSVKEALGIKAGCVILYVGRLVRHKGIHALLLAFQRLRTRGEDVALLLVGDGPLRPSIEHHSACGGLDSLHVHHWVQHEELPKFYGLADIFVLPSWEEPWGVVVTEAMACGLPVVVTRQVGAAQDLIADALTGRVVPENDPVSLCEALGELASSPMERRAMGRRAFERVRGWNHSVGIENFRLAAAQLTDSTLSSASCKASSPAPGP